MERARGKGRGWAKTRAPAADSAAAVEGGAVASVVGEASGAAGAGPGGLPAARYEDKEGI